MKRAAAPILAAVAAFVLGVVVSPGPDLQLDGCVIRLLATGPAILDDANHHCSPRVTAVSVAAGGDLHIVHTAVTEVVSASVAIDETLSARGVIAGARAGLTYTDVHFFDTDTGASVAANSANVAGGKSNIFVTWLVLA